MSPPPTDPVAERVRGAADGLVALLAEAATARTARAEAGPAGPGRAGSAGPDPVAPEAEDDSRGGTGAVCAWNHFENIPTFYNWNNRPR